MPSLKSSFFAGVLSLLTVCAPMISCAPSEVVQKDQVAPTTIVDVPPEAVASAPKSAHQGQPDKKVAKIPGKESADGPKKIVALPESTVEIDGDSTLRKYSSKATELAVQVKFDPSPKRPEDVIKEKLSEFALVIPEAGLKSGNDTLDKHMADALKAETNADIRAVVKSYELKGKNADGSYQVTASVELTVAGTTKTVPVDATLLIEGKNVRIQGAKELLMTDFNVKPPVLMLGVIKAADAITIRFNLLLGLV